MGLSDDFQFPRKEVKISPTNPELEALSASKIQVCGSIVTSESDGLVLSVKASPISPDADSFLIPIQMDSTFCQFLPVGEYSLSVVSTSGEIDPNL